MVDIFLDDGVDHESRPPVANLFEFPRGVHRCGELVVAGKMKRGALRADAHDHAGKILPKDVKFRRQLPLIQNGRDDNPADIPCEKDLPQALRADAWLIKPEIVDAIAELAAMLAQTAGPGAEGVVFLQAVAGV